MIKKFIVLFMCLGLAVPAQSQTQDELKALALAQAKITSDATVAQDYATVLDYTLPAVLDLMGGKEAALESVQTAMRAMAQNDGIKVKSSDVVKMVGFAFEQDQYRCVIENHIVVQTGPDSAVESTSYIIGLYNQEMGKWHFIEAGEFKNKRLMDMVLPNFETQLVIPDDIRTEIKN